jgi:hypothetical protein
MIFHWVT